MLISEKKGVNGTEIIFSIRNSCLEAHKNKKNSTNYTKKFVSWLKDVFLPQGYPYSVSPDYIQYQFWDSVQAYCSNLAGALSLHATLVGIGVGTENASAIAAAITWLTKDGAGMISSIAFAYLKGSELDNNCKQWRLFADVANDGAHFVKLLAPYLPIPFSLTLCLSSIISSLVGVAGGATRASLIQHQALCDNMADVAAKDGSQETLVNLAGLLTSLTLLPYLTSNQIIVWITFTSCVFLHLFSNYKAMRSLNIKTLNRGRLLIILESWTTEMIMPNIHHTNSAEPMLFGPAFKSFYLTNSFKLKMGSSITEVYKNCSPDERLEFSRPCYLDRLATDNYQLFLIEEKKEIIAIFGRNASNIDYLKSFWSAYVCSINVDRSISNCRPKFLIPKDPKVSVQSVSKTAIDKARDLFPHFQQALQKEGWLLDPLRLNIGEWRCEIQVDAKKIL